MEQNSEQDKQRKKRPGKQGLHGEIYQLKLLMLFLKRGVDNGYSFQLSTEKKEARKFDDLFFEITKDGKKEYRLLQAKHKEDESKKITFDSLLTESDGDYSLVKYFFSYQDSKKEKLFQNGTIKDVTVCTNIDLDSKDKYELNGISKTIEEIIKKVEDSDSILDVNSENSHKNVRYRFHHDIISLLKPKLQDYNLTRLAKRLVECLLKNNIIKHQENNDIFKSYHAVLANEIIDTKNKKIFDGFLNESNTLSEEAKRFRQILKEEITRQSQGKFNLEKINVAIVANRADFNLSDEFGLVKDVEVQNWPNDTSELAKYLIENILSAKRIKHNKDPLRRYHVVVANEVIDVEKKKFRDEFMSGKGISEDAKKFRNVLETESQSQGKLSLEEINGARTNANKRIGLTLSSGFGKGGNNNWPNDAISDDDIKDFLDHLVFAVNQPNEQQLGNIIENDISKEFNFAAKDYVYNEFFVKMLDWLNGKGKEFISYEDGKSFFDKAKQKLSELELTGLTVEYISKVEKFGIQFNLEACQEIQLNNFINSQNSNTQIFNVVTEQNTLSAIKVYQILHCLFLHQNSYIFMQLDSVLHLKDRVVKAFKGNNNLLIVECKPTNNDLQELYQDLKGIVQNPSKKIILISQENDPLANKFKEDSSMSNKYQEKIDDKKSLIDLRSESQNKILNEEKLIFQGEKISIKQLLSLEKETEVPRETLDKLNLGASELEILLKDSIVEIWNEHPQLSDLESAYYKTYTRIGLDQLKQALAKANPEDKFIFVGNINKVKQLIPAEQQDTLTHFKDRRSVPLDSHRFVLLDAGQEDKQFKQMCHQVDKANIEKKAGVKQPVLYLLKEEGNDWIWKQTYTRDFYIERRFYPVVVKKEISKLVTESHSSDFIVFSGINEKELLSFLEVKNEKDNFKKNTIVLMDEAAAQKEFNRLCNDSTNHKSIHWLKVNEDKGKKQVQWYDSCGEVSRLRERLDKKLVNYSLDEMSLAEKEKIMNFVTKSDSSDFIVFSGIDEEELLSLFEVENEKDNFKKNIIVLMDEAAAQKEFDHLSSVSTNHKSIHWLKVEGKKQLQWYDSCGEVTRLRERLDKEAVNFSIDEMSLADKKERLMVLADEPGMGKSTTLARVAEFIKKLKPLSWVIKIDLNRHQKLFSKSVKTKEEVIDLFFQIDPTLKKNPLAQKILKHQLECPGKVVLLCDGFDEVKLEKQGYILTLFDFLKKESAVNIWVTTRVHDQKKLEDHLSVLAYTFQPLDETKQINFLSQFWTTTLKLTGKSQDLLILEDYAKEVIQRFEQSIQAFKGDRTFISIPLRARMLAEVFHEKIKKALAENKASSEFIKAYGKFVIGDLYQQFIDQKYDIYLGDKTTIQGLGSDSKSILTETYTNDYKFLAMKTLFHSVEIAPLLSNKKLKLLLNTLSRIGLIQGNMEPVFFIHRTFAEFFAAKWLAEHKENIDVKNFIGIQLFKKESSVVRRFFDHFLTKSIPSHNTVLRGDMSTFKKLLNTNFDKSKTDSLGRTVLHMAAQEGRDEIIQYLWEVISNNELVSDQFGKTPLHYAACFGHDKVVNQLLRNLIDIDLDDHIFRTPLHFDTEIEGNRLFNIPEYTKSNLARLVNKQDDSGNPPLYYAADNEHWNAACNLLLHGADYSILTIENKKKLLLFAAHETHGISANSFHHLRPIFGLLSIQIPEAIQGLNSFFNYPRLLSFFFDNGHTKVIDALLGSIQDLEIRKRIANQEDNSLLPIRRITEHYDFNDADHLKVMKYLFNESTHHGLNIDSSTKGIVLLVAATQGNLNTFKYLVEEKIAPVSYSNAGSYTVVDRALLENHQLTILEYLWENYRESINDSGNRTPLHIAAYFANLQAVHYLCAHNAEINVKNDNGRTPLHYAAQAQRVMKSVAIVAKLTGHQKIVQYLIEEQGADINLVNTDGKTALDLAIENEQWTTTDYLIKKKAQAHYLSLVSNIKTFFESPLYIYALHLAIRNRETKWIRFLLQHQVDVNRLNHEGRTPLHCVAVANWPDKVEIMELLLQRGAQYDVRDNNNKTALNLLLELKYAYGKIIWLLQLIEKFFNSQNLMQDLKSSDTFSDTYDRNNPMQFILNARSVKNGTLLHVAVNTGDLAALEHLLKLNRWYLQLKFDPQFNIAKYYEAIDISAKDEQGNTSLHCAAKLGDQKSLHLLLEEGAIFNARNSQGRTPKFQAKRKKHKEIATFLQQIEDLFDAVKRGTKLEIIDDKLQRVLVYVRYCDGKTLLHLAAQKGQIEHIKVLLNCIDPLKQREAINVLDHQHGTPLHDAAANGQAEVIRLLLQRGAQFNIKDKQNRTPLDRLPNPDNSLLKSVDQLFNDIQLNLPGAVIEELHRFDASQEDLHAILHARDELGTLLHWAAREHYLDVLQQLLMRGAIYDDQDYSFKSNDLFKLIKEWMYDKKPLKFSVEEVTKDQDKLTIVKKARNREGKTPLHTNANYFRLKYLLKQGVDLKVQDQDGNTPLHDAAGRGDIAVVKLFLDNGAEVNAENKIKQTPLHMASSEGHFVIVQLLLNEKAEPNIQDKNGKTPLQLAEDHFVIVQRLLNEKEDPNIQEVIDILKSKSILTTKGLIEGEVLFEEGLPGPSHQKV